MPKKSHCTLITGKAKPQLTTLASRLPWPISWPINLTVALVPMTGSVGAMTRTYASAATTMALKRSSTDVLESSVESMLLRRSQATTRALSSTAPWPVWIRAIARACCVTLMRAAP
jgi:hypothetical protein